MHDDLSSGTYESILDHTPAPVLLSFGFGEKLSPEVFQLPDQPLQWFYFTNKPVTSLLRNAIPRIFHAFNTVHVVEVQILGCNMKNFLKKFVSTDLQLVTNLFKRIKIQRNSEIASIGVVQNETWQPYGPSIWHMPTLLPTRGYPRNSCGKYQFDHGP